MDGPVLIVSPDKSIHVMDDVIGIMIQGLIPFEPITVEAYIRFVKNEWTGYGHFYADENGVVDLENQVSLGGAYKGLEPMGIFSSMVPWPSRSSSPRVIIHEANVVQPYTIYVYSGHHSFDDLMGLQMDTGFFGTKSSQGYVPRMKLIHAEIKRTYLDPTVSRVPLTGDPSGIRGTMFIPSGKGPFPGVIDMFGGVGGCVEPRAALMARRGYTTLALAYCGHEDLQYKSVMDFDMSYFDDAVKWFNKHPMVSHDTCEGIAVVGVCEGAKNAFLGMQRNPEIKVVALINTAFMTLFDPWGDQPWVWFTQECYDPNGRIKGDCMNIFHLRNGFTTYKKGTQMELDFTPVPDSLDVKVLILSAKNDLSVDQFRLSNQICELFEKSGKSNQIEQFFIEGEGHLMEPPYAPLATSMVPLVNAHLYIDGRYLGLPMNYSGDLKRHGPNSKLAWDKLLDFLERNLGPKHQPLNIKSKL